MQKNGKMMPCKYCGKKVYIFKARQKSFKYCSRYCHGKAILSTPENQARIKHPVGKNHPRWKGGTINKERGYKIICLKGKQVYEHRYVMEQYLGRKLNCYENVHHINGIKTDNRIENLEILSRSKHTKQNPKKKNPLRFVKCLNCNKIFYAKKIDVVFCSQLCWYKYPYKKSDKITSRRQEMVKNIIR